MSIIVGHSQLFILCLTIKHVSNHSKYLGCAAVLIQRNSGGVLLSVQKKRRGKVVPSNSPALVPVSVVTLLPSSSSSWLVWSNSTVMDLALDQPFLVGRA